MITTMTPANIIMLLSPAQSYCGSTCLFVDKKQLQGSELCDLTLQFSCTNRAVNVPQGCLQRMHLCAWYSVWMHSCTWYSVCHFAKKMCFLCLCRWKVHSKPVWYWLVSKLNRQANSDKDYGLATQNWIDSTSTWVSCWMRFSNETPEQKSLDVFMKTLLQLRVTCFINTQAALVSGCHKLLVLGMGHTISSLTIPNKINASFLHR